MAKEQKQEMTERLKNLGVGTETILDCRNPTHCESVRTLCYRIPKVYASHSKKKYSCKINYMKKQVTIKVTNAK